MKHETLIVFGIETAAPIKIHLTNYEWSLKYQIYDICCMTGKDLRFEVTSSQEAKKATLQEQTM